MVTSTEAPYSVCLVLCSEHGALWDFTCSIAALHFSEAVGPSFQAIRMPPYQWSIPQSVFLKQFLMVKSSELAESLLYANSWFFFSSPFPGFTLYGPLPFLSLFYIFSSLQLSLRFRSPFVLSLSLNPCLFLRLIFILFSTKENKLSFVTSHTNPSSHSPHLPSQPTSPPFTPQRG